MYNIFLVHLFKSKDFLLELRRKNLLECVLLFRAERVSGTVAEQIKPTFSIWPFSGERYLEAWPAL